MKPTDGKTAEEIIDEETVEEADDDREIVDEMTDEGKWAEIDELLDRYEGPSDTDEVNLDEDDVQWVDPGALMVILFEEMQLQLQVDGPRRRVQSFLVGDGVSVMRVALFADPKYISMLVEVRGEIAVATEKEGGEITLLEGPLRVELCRQQPVTNAQGRRGTHVSRIWLAGGPG